MNTLILYSNAEPENHEETERIQADYQAFRAYMDRNNAARKALKPTPPTASIPQKTFESWRQVPSEFKTRNQWLRFGRRVHKHEKPTARVVYPQLIDRGLLFDSRNLVLHETDEFTIISEGATDLFHERQTVPYSASSRTRAYWAFDDIFFKHARKDCWIRKTNIYGSELDDWITENEFEFAELYHQRNLLSEQLIRQHINQKQIIGIKGGDLTRFVIIDLDFHGRNSKVFEAQAEVLLDKFHGVGTWHFQVRRQDVTGLQLIYVFEQPREIKVVQKELRQILIELDAQNPELAQDAKAAGMKSIAELEIYPTQDNGNGVRLPLCRDREMLLDEPLPLVMHKKNQVQDVEGYIRWLDDPDRKFMPKERVLDYLHYFTWEESQPRTRTRTLLQPQSNGINQNKWKGNLRRWLDDFWIKGNANGRPLNEHIAVLARLAAVYGYSEDEIIEGLNRLVLGLPACSQSCSSRLLNGKFRQIENVIQTTAQYACENNGHQHDSQNSKSIFASALQRWSGFDPLDISTWDSPSEKVTVNPNWTDEQRKRLCAFFRKPLFIKNDDLIIRFLNEIVNLTISKEREESGWGKEYLLKWMKDKFPSIKCAKDEKRHRIIKCLESEGIIQVNYKGRAGMYATHWTLGKVAKLALGITSNETESQTAPPQKESSQSPSITSTYYSSLFLENRLNGSDFKATISVDGKQEPTKCLVQVQPRDGIENSMANEL